MSSRRSGPPPSISARLASRAPSALALLAFVALAALLTVWRHIPMSWLKPIVAGDELRGMALGFFAGIPLMAIGAWALSRDGKPPLHIATKSLLSAIALASLGLWLLFLPLERSRPGAGPSYQERQLERELPGVHDGAVAGLAVLILLPAGVLVVVAGLRKSGPE